MSEKIGGKNSSLLAQIVAASWIAGWTAYKFITSPESIEMRDILLSGFGIAACFIAVYFSIIMDKIKDIKIGPTDKSLQGNNLQGDVG